jgi:hypothetical protein
VALPLPRNSRFDLRSASLLRLLSCLWWLVFTLACDEVDPTYGNSYLTEQVCSNGFCLEYPPSLTLLNDCNQHIARRTTLVLGAKGLTDGQVLTRRFRLGIIGGHDHSESAPSILALQLNNPASSLANDEPRLRCVVPSQDNVDCAKATYPKLWRLPADRSDSVLEFVIEYSHVDASPAATAQLSILTNDRSASHRSFELILVASPDIAEPSCPVYVPEPQGLPLAASPVAAQYDATPIGTITKVSLLLTNMTGEEQQVTTVDLSTLPGDRFRVWLTGMELPTGVTNTGGPYLMLPAWGKASMQVEHTNLDGKAQSGTILLAGTDLETDVIARIPVQVTATEVVP